LYAFLLLIEQVFKMHIKLKKSFFSLCLLLGISSINYAGNCPATPPYDSPQYCTSFENIARCYCMNSGLSAKICNDVHLIYDRMVATFGSLDRACKFQKNSSYQQCMDSWICYLKGGQAKDGTLCNGTGLPC
jgi:hypothetical protein